jgi:LMBR1 domain-containing protein 1
MVDLFLIILVASILGLAIFINVKLLFYFQQKEEGRFAQSVFVKAVIVISLTLAWFVNLLLPIDVRNSRPRPGVFDMNLVWTVTFITLAAFLVLVVPGVMFYSEVEGDDIVKKKRRHVLCNLFFVLIFACSAVAISYPFLSEAAIPVVEYACDAWEDAGAPMSLGSTEPCSNGADKHLAISVGLQVYVIAVLCWVGWWFFVIFGGIGLSAVPLDLILAFRDRPKAIGNVTYQERRQVVGAVARTLLETAEKLQERESGASTSKSRWGWGSQAKKQVKADYNKFRRDVLIVEEEFERLQIAKFHQGENLAVSISKLVLGILCVILSIMWVLQIILVVMMRQIEPSVKISFMDAIFAACEGTGAFAVGTALFAVVNIYLLVCVVKGCFKFGMRVFFLFSIHPMRHQATPLNSILFNVEMLLISSAAVVQFAHTAFADYARLTDAEVIFAAQIKYMTFYSFFFEHNIFIYTLLGWFVLALIYLLIRPKDTSGEQKFSLKADQQLAKILGKGKKDASNANASKSTG